MRQVSVSPTRPVRRLRACAERRGGERCTGGAWQTGVPVEDVVSPGVYVTDIADAEIGRTGR